jgi:hypothetical protein
MEMNKKGLSTIVVTLIIILLSLVAVGIVWAVVSNILSGETHQIGFSQFTLSLKINNVYAEEGNLSVNVKRNAGAGELVKIKFILSDGSNSEAIEQNSNLSELETANFILVPHKLISTEIKTVSIVPILESDDGSEIEGNIADTYDIGTIIGEECVPETSEETCGNWVCGIKQNNCSTNVSCGYCPQNQTCSNGACLSNCTNICSTNGTKQCSGNGYKTCGNYDNDSCLDWSSVTSCPSSWTCDSLDYCRYSFVSKNITIGQNYNYGAGQDQATVEFVDLTAYRNKELTLKTNTKGYVLHLLVFNGKIDLNKWWGDSKPLYFEADNKINSDLRFAIPPNAEFFSIVYVTNPVVDHTPENLQITRDISIKEPKVPTDFSKTFITDYSSFPDNILNALINPFYFNENMNREYVALKDFTGEDSGALDNERHLRLIVTDIAYCGLAGNPIKMDPVCMGADGLNTGNPGWGAAHELGHLFSCKYSYCWEGSEGWANFMAYYSYYNGIFINSEFDRNFWFGHDWEISTKKTDILQMLMISFVHQTGNWDITKKFFRKYIASDPAAISSDTEKMKLIVRYLAESARETTGKQSDYDYVVDYLVGKGFPHP